MKTFENIGFGGRDRAPFATHASDSKGRLVQEPDSPTRTPFQRDRDRIVHCTAFRRLNHKTQVFFSHEDDHYRTRLTHTIEVAQIARALARAFKLDEDLAEAIALVHDFGHTPFGHTGEEVLAQLMQPYGGFEHNAHALRVVTKLEQRYADFDGLNLTWETLEGLVKHNGPLVHGGKPLPYAIADYCTVHDLELSNHAGLEAQVAAIADDIAYNTHDIDDGLRAGLLNFDMLKQVDIIAAPLALVDDRYPDIDETRRGHETTRRVMTAMVEDAILTTMNNLDEVKPQNVNDVYHAGRTLVEFSPEMTKLEKQLKSFLFANMYRHENVVRLRAQAEQVVSDLFQSYIADPSLMGSEWSADISKLDDIALAQRVSDFLAGMTDNFALAQHRRLFDRTPDLR
ncbi:MAG: deoxyguanosinetriphosphate triphosphohydrolase [Pseudomonadota bacterium]